MDHPALGAVGSLVIDPDKIIGDVFRGLCDIIAVERRLKSVSCPAIPGLILLMVTLGGGFSSWKGSVR
ncbi:MAG: hypothetical protein Ct9H300mP16_17930 [Pseudomonadota bacterium]|nr:MAG: hypothetical protein Ct9H300mP16_17930 [Pseudomonadota bacterium]